jgi:acetyl-CoA/propionyl-CoA/long-chain acyl-CoA carboxylase, biotin carboxylase, biotin carboxyl carrier protein
MVTGIDLVQAQLRVARGEPLWLTQEQIGWHGHAIECRINAEDPAANFRPAIGTITDYVEPSGFGVRVDSGARPGYTIPQYYDSLIAKLVVWGADRSAAIARMRRALADYRIGGVVTTIPFHQLALAHPAFARGEATVNFIPQHLAAELHHIRTENREPALTASIENQEPAAIEAARTFHVEVNGRRFSVRVAEQGVGGRPSGGASEQRSSAGRPRPGSDRGRSSVAGRRSAVAGAANGVASSLQGTVVAVRAAPGQAVEVGQVLFIIEAMKMENEITAHKAGVVEELAVKEGDAVTSGATIAVIRSPA